MVKDSEKKKDKKVNMKTYAIGRIYITVGSEKMRILLGTYPINFQLSNVDNSCLLK